MSFNVRAADPGRLLVDAERDVSASSILLACSVCRCTLVLASCSDLNVPLTAGATCVIFYVGAGVAAGGM